MKTHPSIIDALNKIDKNFIEDMKKQKRFDILSHIDEIIATYVSSQFNAKLTVGWAHSDKNYEVAIKYIAIKDNMKAPYCTVITTVTLDRTIAIFGAPYISSDGEYRSNILNLSNMEVVTILSRKVFEDPENAEFIRKLMENVTIKTKVGKDFKRIKNALSKIRLPEMLLVYCVYAVSRAVTLSSNILPEFAHVMLSLADTCQNLTTYAASILQFYRHTAMSVKIGIKVVPVTDIDIQNIGLITRPCWCEIYITRLLTNLSINSICYNYPYVYSWIIIDGYEYDNPLVKSKVEHSKNAEKIKEKLGELMTQTMEGYENLPGFLDLSIKYLDNNLVFSTKSVGIVIGDSGSPLSIISMDSPINQKIKEKPFILNSILYQTAYALMCMNKMGIIHNDLHLNNIVISMQGNPENIFNIYHFGDTYYTLRTDGVVPTVIDFSRSIMSRKTIEAIGNRDIYNALIKNTIRGIKMGYKYYLPEFYSNHKHHISYYINKLEDSFWNLYSAIDMFRLSSSLIEVLGDEFDKDPLVDIKNMMYAYLTDKVLEMSGNEKNPNEAILDMLDINTDYTGTVMYYCNYDNDPFGKPDVSAHKYCEFKNKLIIVKPLHAIIKRVCGGIPFPEQVISEGHFPKNMPVI